MKLIELLAVGIRILGVYFLIKALTSLPSAFSLLSTYSTNVGMEADYIVKAIVYANVLIFAIASFFLTKFPITISGFLIPVDIKSASTASVESSVLSIAAFTITGIYILSWSLPNLLFNSLALYNMSRLNFTDGLQYSETTINIVVNFVEIAIALYLVLGANGLHKIIVKLRS